MSNKINIQRILIIIAIVCLGIFLWLCFPIVGTSNFEYLTNQNSYFDIRNVNVAKKFITSPINPIPIHDEDLTCLEEITYGDYTYMLFKIANNTNSPNYSIITLHKDKVFYSDNFCEKTMDGIRMPQDATDAFFLIGKVISDPDVERINIYISAPEPNDQVPSISLAAKDHLYDDGKVFFYLIPYTRTMLKNGFLVTR